MYIGILEKRVWYGVNWMKLVRVGHKDGFSHTVAVPWDGNNEGR
jgi:hypothetical protein